MSETCEYVERGVLSTGFPRGKPAVYKAWYGPMKRRASTWGTDTPFEENHTFRCERHQFMPTSAGKEPWLWKILKKEVESEG